MLNILNFLPLSATVYTGDTHPWVLWSFIILGILAFSLCFTFPFWQTNWENIKGTYNEDGMRKLFMFNRQPYLFVLYLSLFILIGTAVSAVILFLIGGVGYALLWVVKLLLWALIIIGWLCLVGGALALFAKEPVGCLPLIIGGVIVAFQDKLSEWGNSCVEAGFDFFNALNLWEYCKYLVETYWVKFLIVVSIPICVGIAAAIIALLCALIFRLVESLMTRRYNIQHPCPFCHNPSEPAIYLSEGMELPIKLRPCTYGLLHITHPRTGEKMPTMILNGRDELSRKCPHCDRIINYKTGVEKHIAFVGLPESGKTCLTYRFVGNMMKNDSGIEFTDEVNPEAQRIILDLRDGKEQDLASKTSVNDMRRSLQILVPGKAPLPYHFFINDVGGELFTNAGLNADYMQFFKDVESVSFLIDPFTMDFSGYDISGEFAKWYNANIKGKDLPTNLEKISNIFDTVSAMAENFVHKPKDIHVNIVLVKSDTGYIPDEYIRDGEMLKAFVSEQMGLGAEMYNLENTYASLNFYAVSALKNQGIDRLTLGIIEDLKVKL